MFLFLSNTHVHNAEFHQSFSEYLEHTPPPSSNPVLFLVSHCHVQFFHTYWFSFLEVLLLLATLTVPEFLQDRLKTLIQIYIK